MTRSLGSTRNLSFGLGRKESKKTPQLDRSFLFNRAGVGLLFGDAELGEHLKQPGWLYFELPRQFVYSDLTHKN
jgi:hypothetical protein